MEALFFFGSRLIARESSQCTVLDVFKGGLDLWVLAVKYRQHSMRCVLCYLCGLARSFKVRH